MNKEMKIGASIRVSRENDSIRLFERVTMNSVLVFTVIVAMLYHFNRISMPIGIFLLGLIGCSILFKRSTIFNIKEGVVERKLQIFEIVLFTYTKKVVGPNYVIYHEAHSHVVNNFGVAVFYYLVLKNTDSNVEIVLIKLRSEKRAEELKNLIEN